MYQVEVSDGRLAIRTYFDSCKSYEQTRFVLIDLDDNNLPLAIRSRTSLSLG